MKFSALTGFWRFWALAMVAFCLGLTVTACNPQSNKTQAAQVPQLVDSTLGDPRTFNAVLSNESPTPLSLMYEGLIAEDAITGKLEPNLAEKWEISPDKKTVKFTMRENLKWSDGQPLTVDDVLFTFRDLYMNPKISSDIQDILKIGKQRAFPSVRKVNDRQIEFTTPEPFSPFLRTLGLTILPKHALEKSVTQLGSDGNPLFLTTWGTGTDPKEIVCNGPYMLESYTATQRLIFRRNPNYWRKDAQGNPQPYIERIIWGIVENRDTELLQFRSGGLDISEPLRPEDFSILKREEKRGGFTVLMGGTRPMTTFIAFNLNQGRRNGKPLVNPVRSKWFNNVKFRQAVAYAIDRERINTNLYRGLGILLNSTILPISPYYLEGGKAYNHDPEKSRQLLREAGFKYNDRNQLLDAEGNLVEFNLMTNSENNLRQAIITQISQDLSKIGMKVNLTPISFNVMIGKLDDGLDWEAYLIGMGGGREPNDGSNVWLPDGSSHAFNQKPQAGKAPLEGRVVSDWEEEIGQLYIQGAQEFDEAKRKEIYGRVQKITQEQLPWIPLVTERIMGVVQNEVQGVKFPETGGALWNIHELRIKD
ncbi:ABC transporter substrate-binding protein [Leptolyngbya sp. NIES-2104]|uniref:ABC transporter substrate-binding protein n=1 Tax=Leptolyngbya sp. NIES-2104 TaxID=1552121 RepID=UPI00073E380C|nr:ABC transporter substrate-binding protein [Leptolyngbya sp. NIES-2104]